MAKTVVAIFDDLNHAHMAVRELRDMGIRNADISLVAHDVTGEYGRALKRPADDTTDGAETGAGIGALVGGIGGLLVGLGALAIPGVGPVIAAGPLGTALSALLGAGAGALAGGVAGGLIGALVDLGVPEDEAGYYAEGVRRGGTLVTVRADDTRVDEVRRVLDRHHAVNIRERVAAWRERGWTRYEPNAKPYTAEQVNEERRAYNLGTGPGSMSDMGRPGPWPVAFTDAETGFRGHYQTTYGRSGYQYEHFRPAYEYGWSLRRDDRYRGWDWKRMEPEARREWESRYPGTTWDEIKGAVRHAWESLKDEVRDIRAGRD